MCYNENMKEVEFKHHVELVNNSKEKDLFEKHKDYILEVTNEFLSGYDFSANLTIRVEDISNDAEFVNGEVSDAFSGVTKYGHFIGLSSMLLRATECDQGLRLCSALFHELAHVYDHHHILKSPYCKFNPMNLSHKTIDDLVFACGYHFWTEYFAYYKTYWLFDEEREKYPTFLKIVNAYKSLKERHAEIDKYVWTDRKRVERKCAGFIKDVEAFIYSLSKYMAGNANKRKSYQYCDKTKNMKEFGEVETIVQRLYAKVAPIFTNTYGRGMTNKIGWLGNSIIVNVYQKFNICPVQGKKRAHYVLYPGEEE